MLHLNRKDRFFSLVMIYLIWELLPFQKEGQLSLLHDGVTYFVNSSCKDLIFDLSM